MFRYFLHYEEASITSVLEYNISQIFLSDVFFFISITCLLQRYQKIPDSKEISTEIAIKNNISYWKIPYYNMMSQSKYAIHIAVEDYL